MSEERRAFILMGGGIAALLFYYLLKAHNAVPTQTVADDTSTGVQYQQPTLATYTAVSLTPISSSDFFVSNNYWDTNGW